MSENAQRILLWFVALAAVLGTAVALRYAPGYRAVAGAVMGGEALPPNVNLRLKRLMIKGRKDGKLAWTMKADQLDTTRTRDRMDFIGHIEATIVRDGVTRAKMTAATAAYTDPPKVLTVSGNLKAVLRGDRAEKRPDLRFAAPQIVWNVGEQKVNCPGFVRLDAGDDYVEGEQLAIDLKTQEYTMNKASGQFMADESNPNVLSALPSLQGLTHEKSGFTARNAPLGDRNFIPERNAICPTAVTGPAPPHSAVGGSEARKSQRQNARSIQRR